ncbi:MAG TPA: hypothetical protein VEW26_05110 [Allosphingosinicella sp.]|nr:hypothetical protein [Allosphingosinicella sp.]
MRPISTALALAASLVALPASAALPPQYQRAAEFRAVVADGHIANAFDGAPIERIEYVRPDLYRVTAGRCRLDVAIVDLPIPAGVVGPRRFAVKAGTKACGR